MLANRALTLTYDGRTAEALEPDGPGAAPRTPAAALVSQEFNGVIAFVEGRCEEALAGVGPQSERAWDLMYALSCCGHLGRVEQARATLARLAETGRNPDWALGISREPYSDPLVRDQLSEGIRLAIMF